MTKPDAPRPKPDARARTFICAALLLCAAGAFRQAPAQAARDAHRHPRLLDMLAEILPDVRVVPVAPERGLEKGNVARSRDGRFEAFTSYGGGEARDETHGYRLFIADRRAGKLYEVRGLPLPQRPLSDLVWAGDRTLLFDRWSQPRHGLHYAFDARAKRLSAAAAFPDEDSLKPRRRSSPRRKRRRAARRMNGLNAGH